VEIGDVYLPVNRAIDDHPRIVISDPELNEDKVVLVNFTGFEGEFRDHSCVLEVGEHGWLTKRTCISYKDATVVSQKQFDELFNRKLMTKLDPVSDDVLRKILKGAEVTDELPNKCRSVLAAQDLID
jgi:hypothetical protein